MAFIIGLLTFGLVVVCLALILLVLIQLPKKEAGIGVAFGGAATDALFGAGSGNVLTKATKYSAVVFFVLALVVGVLQKHSHAKNTNEFRLKADQAAQTAPAAPVAQPAPTPAPAAGGSPLLSQPAVAPTVSTSTVPAGATPAKP
jgi:preprotein translocase subunit SecG